MAAEGEIPAYIHLLPLKVYGEASVDVNAPWWMRRIKNLEVYKFLPNYTV